MPPGRNAKLACVSQGCVERIRCHFDQSEVTISRIAGMRLAYTFPLRVALALVPTMLGAAFVAAIWPAEAVVRGSLVEALEYE